MALHAALRLWAAAPTMDDTREALRFPLAHVLYGRHVMGARTHISIQLDDDVQIDVRPCVDSDRLRLWIGLDMTLWMTPGAAEKLRAACTQALRAREREESVPTRLEVLG